MSVLLTARRTVVLWLLTLAAIVVLLGIGQGIGQAAATSTSSKPQSTDAFTVQVLKSARAYWHPRLTALGHPGWTFFYRTVQGNGLVNSPCGPVGDPDGYRDAEPAFYCRTNNKVYLSTQWLYDHMSHNGATPYGVAYAVTHEVGHAVQKELRLLPPSGARVEPLELQADCFSGMWVRHQVNIGAATTKDASDARHGAQSVGDYFAGRPSHHGTPAERGVAWTRGYSGGFASCQALNPPVGR